MPENMSKDQAPAPQGSTPENGPQQSPSDLLATAMQNLMQVGEIMTRSSVVPPEEVQQYAQLVAGLQSFIQKNLGGAPKEPQPAPRAAGGPMPTQAGGNRAAQPSQF